MAHHGHRMKFIGFSELGTALVSVYYNGAFLGTWDTAYFKKGCTMQDIEEMFARAKAVLDK